MVQHLQRIFAHPRNCLGLLALTAALFFGPVSGMASASANYNGRWVTVNSRRHYLPIDEWRNIDGKCYRLLSDHSVDKRATYRGTCEAPTGRG